MKEKLYKKTAESEWASNQMKKQGDALLGIVRSYMDANSISRVSIEAIDKAVSKSGSVLNISHIKQTIKDLIARELLARDGQTYMLTRKAKEDAKS